MTSAEPKHQNGRPEVSGGDHHREIHPLNRLAKWVAGNRRLVLVAWAVSIVIMAPLAVTLQNGLSGAGWDAAGSESELVRNELQSDFPNVGAEAAFVVVSQELPFESDPTALDEIMVSLESAPDSTILANPLTADPEAGLVSQSGTTAIVPMHLDGSDDADLPESAGELIAYVDTLDVSEGVVVKVTGQWAMWSDFNQINEKALRKAELLSGLPSLILLFLAFGSLIAAGLPLILAVSGIAFGFGMLHLIGMVIPLSVWSMNFSMMIGLAVGIDYSLFIVSRYREERFEGKAQVDAMASTLSTAGFAVLLSALAVVFSLAAVFIVPVMVFRSMALGMILSVSAVAVAALTLLPAVLLLMGDRVLNTRSQHRIQEHREGLWSKWTGMALNRPGTTLAAGLVLLSVFVVPAVGIELGMPDARVVDEGYSSRDGYELMVAEFGEGALAPLFVTVDVDEADMAVASALREEATADARVVTGPSSNDRVVVRVTPVEGVGASQTQELVSGLRSDFQSVAASALVGGPAGQNYDLTHALISKAPIAMLIILIGAFLMLMVIFRSIVIAFVSVALNLLSVLAAFGFSSLIFQHGYGSGLIGIEPQGFVDAWAPVFFFALLFGLSMDYQLFLLAAIREHFEQTGDTGDAVKTGISRTGRPITNAALVMIVVFIAFGVTGPIPPTELGLTLAFAVLIDATVIRMLLVPAIMGLLGEKNWWLPKWIDDRIPTVHFSH